MPEQTRSAPAPQPEYRPELAALLGLQPLEIGKIEYRGLEIIAAAELGRITIRIQASDTASLQTWASKEIYFEIAGRAWPLRIDNNGTAELQIPDLPSNRTELPGLAIQLAN